MRKFALLSALALGFATVPSIPSVAAAAGYGQSGCGLGSLIIKKNNFLQIFAATTNGTFGNQTFAISTGTSNCDGWNGDGKSAISFVETNRQAVAKDISRGQGETIASLTAIGGCSSADAVGASLQKNYSKIFPSSQVSDTEAGQNLVKVLQSDASLACTALN